MDTDTLLRNNIVKLKQKIIDTSKLLELYNSAKSELDVAHKKMRCLTMDINNLRFQLDQASKEREPLLKKIQEAEEEQIRLREESDQIKISYNSQKSFCNQLKAELDDMKKEKLRRVSQSKREIKEKESLEQVKIELEGNLKKANVRIHSLLSEVDAYKSKKDSQDSKFKDLLCELLPVLVTLPTDSIEHKWINKIESALGKPISKPPPKPKKKIPSPPVIPVEDFEYFLEEPSFPAPAPYVPNRPRATSPSSSRKKQRASVVTERVVEDLSSKSPEFDGSEFLSDEIFTTSPPPVPRSRSIEKRLPVTIEKENSSLERNRKRTRVSPEATVPRPSKHRKIENNSVPSVPSVPKEIESEIIQEIEENSADESFEEELSEQSVEESEDDLTPIENPVRSYSIRELLTSVETYQQKLVHYVRWPKESEEAYLKRRLNHFLTFSTSTLSPVEYQNRILTAVYDLTMDENKLTVDSIVRSILSSFTKIHHLLLRNNSLSSKRKEQDTDIFLTDLVPSKNIYCLKIKLINDLLWNIHLALSAKNVSFQKSLMIHMVEKIVSKPDSSDPHLVHSVLFKQRVLLCKRFTEQARACGDISIVRNLVYHIIYNFPSACILMVASIVSVWSLPLEEQPDSILFSVIQFLIRRSVDSNSEKSAENKLLLSFLQENCKWKQEQPTEEEFILQVLTKCINILKSCVNCEDEIIYEIGNVMRLISLMKGWTWTYNTIICQKLSQLMVPTSSVGTLGSVVYLLGVVCNSNILQSYPVNPTLPGVGNLRARLLSLVQPSTPVNLQIQSKAAQALLDLSGGQIDLAQPAVSWFGKLTCKQQDALPENLVHNIRMVSEKLSC